MTFFVDGEPIKEFEGGLPDKAIKPYINAWFPEWLSGENPDSGRATSVWTGSSNKSGPGAFCRM